MARRVFFEFFVTYAPAMVYTSRSNKAIFRHVLLTFEALLQLHAELTSEIVEWSLQLHAETFSEYLTRTTETSVENDLAGALLAVVAQDSARRRLLEDAGDTTVLLHLLLRRELPTVSVILWILDGIASLILASSERQRLLNCRGVEALQRLLDYNSSTETARLQQEENAIEKQLDDHKQQLALRQKDHREAGSDLQRSERELRTATEKVEQLVGQLAQLGRDIGDQEVLIASLCSRSELLLKGDKRNPGISMLDPSTPGNEEKVGNMKAELSRILGDDMQAVITFLHERTKSYRVSGQPKMQAVVQELATHFATADGQGVGTLSEARDKLQTLGQQQVQVASTLQSAQDNCQDLSGRCTGLILTQKRLKLELARLERGRAEYHNQVLKLENRLLELEVKADNEGEAPPGDSVVCGSTCILWAVSDFLDDEMFADIMASVVTRPHTRVHLNCRRILPFVRVLRVCAGVHFWYLDIVTCRGCATCHVWTNNWSSLADAVTSTGSIELRQDEKSMVEWALLQISLLVAQSSQREIVLIEDPGIELLQRLGADHAHASITTLALAALHMWASHDRELDSLDVCKCLIASTDSATVRSLARTLTNRSVSSIFSRHVGDPSLHTCGHQLYLSAIALLRRGEQIARSPASTTVHPTPANPRLVAWAQALPVFMPLLRFCAFWSVGSFALLWFLMPMFLVSHTQPNIHTDHIVQTVYWDNVWLLTTCDTCHVGLPGPQSRDARRVASVVLHSLAGHELLWAVDVVTQRAWLSGAVSDASAAYAGGRERWQPYT
jgi:hypothetical protein